ncbi:MAG: three component ABC system middle component [Gallionella sp.]
MTDNAIHHYMTLTRSPLLLVPVIEAFFRELPKKEKSILLGYLVLPIVLYPSAKNFLVRAIATSSMRTFCTERERLAGLPQRVQELREVSNLAMQNSIACGRLSLCDDLSIQVEAMDQLDTLLRDEIKAAKRLAQFLEPYDVPTVYRLLGVKNL